jgi:hypothetical protein
MINLPTPIVRELHSRFTDGIHVRLLWHGQEDRLWVSVDDSKTDQRFDVEVRDRARALEIFRHPFVYAALAR